MSQATARATSRGPIFPVPPFEQIGIMAVVAGIIDSLTQDIEDAAVDGAAVVFTEPGVQLLRIGVP